MTKPPMYSVREHYAPAGALRRGDGGEVLGAHFSVREHHAPVGALRLLVVVDAQRCAVRRELDQGIEVLPLSELLLCLVIHERVELAPDIALEDVLCVLVVGAHDVYLSPHPGGMPVLSCRKSTCSTPGWRVSKMRFHDTILLPLK